MGQATGPRLALPRTDYLRLLRLAGLEDTDVYRIATTDARDTLEIWASSMQWLIGVAWKERIETAAARLRCPSAKVVVTAP